VVAPAPAPVAAVAAPKPVAERVTLDADTLFDFDKSTLRPAGKEALDVFVLGLRDISPEVISAVGHTDRFGTDAYNQHLSDQRAASVKAYLVSKGIDANRVATEGKGESQPVTKSGDCQGAKSTAVIACLQPDRRVDVEVIGNRIQRLTMQQ
jgi:OOP family OmpA-OmpF porin